MRSSMHAPQAQTRTTLPSPHPASQLAAPRRRSPITSSSTERGDGGETSVGKAALSRLEELVPTAGEPAPPPAPAAAEQRQQQQQQQQQQEGGDEEGFLWFDRPATPQTGPLRRRGMEPGKGGRYLDSEKFTRDPLELRVGQRTALGASSSLPEAPHPYVSRALAAASALAGAAYLAGLPFSLAMDTVAVASGDLWGILVAALQPISAANAGATAAALLTAGTYAERRLGSGLFGAAFLLAGACSAICWYGASAAALVAAERGAVFAGASGALLGPAAALAAFAASNWGVLSGAQRAQCAAAAAALAAVTLTELDLAVTQTTLDGLALPIHGASAAVGGALGLLAGPQLQVQRELNIEDGSMTISGDEEELEVVVDRRTAPQRAAAIGGAALALWALLWLADQVVATGAALDFVLTNWDAPEVQAELFEAAGADRWDLNA